MPRLLNINQKCSPLPLRWILISISQNRIFIGLLSFFPHINLKNLLFYFCTLGFWSSCGVKSIECGAAGCEAEQSCTWSSNMLTDRLQSKTATTAMLRHLVFSTYENRLQVCHNSLKFYVSIYCSGSQLVCRKSLQNGPRGSEQNNGIKLNKD
jgi:hypothetical protein